MKFLARLKIGSRLILAFLVVAVIGGLIGLAGLLSMSRINDLNDQLYERELLGLSYVKEANIALMAAGRARANYASATSIDERRSYKAFFDDRVSVMRKQVEAARGLFFTEDGKRAFDDFDRVFADWLAKAEAFFKVAQTRDLAIEDAELRRANDAARTANDQLDQLMTTLVSIKEQNGSDAASTGTQVYEQMRLLLIGMSLLGVLTGFFFGWLTTRSITRPLSAAIDAARRVADGDLTGRIHSDAKDETGELMRALGAMNASLATIVRDVRDGSEGIASASSQIAQGNTDLSQRTEEQASSLEETAASMEELTSTVQQNANNAAQADKLVDEASQVATKGGAVVKSVVQTMSSISDSSRRIAEITSVIDGIAFQTNILALNAAVEAARAGEQGRGFAVVAGEVRTLAQRSAVAAKEIKELIDESVARVDDGNRQVADAGKTMEEIVDAVKRVSALVSEISAASVEQASGIGQVNQAVSQMDEVTQQNAALVEEAAAAAASLLEQAERLAQQVRRFRVDAAQGAHAAPVHVAASRPAAAGKPAARPARPAPAPRAAAAPAAAAAALPALAAAGAGAEDDWEKF